jgi:2-polyprenyl-6-methoxyphenol hydroxylase-like FAD-dependent oxidoreductase
MTTRPANRQPCLEPALGGRRVGIVGAGIGGLTAALSLLRAGFDVRVFEQASALREAGAGVQLKPQRLADLAPAGSGRRPRRRRREAPGLASAAL